MLVSHGGLVGGASASKEVSSSGGGSNPAMVKILKGNKIVSKCSLTWILEHFEIRLMIPLE